MIETVCAKCGKALEDNVTRTFVDGEHIDAFCSQKCFSEHVLMPLAFEALFGELEEGD